MANSRPAGSGGMVSSQTLRFQGGRLAAKLVTDYSNAKFDNNNRVINSSTKVDCYDGNEQLVSSTTVAYDQNGAVVNKQTQTFPVAASTGPAKTYADLVSSWNNPSARTSQPVQPAAVAKTSASAPATANEGKTGAPTVKNTYRSDGTLETSLATNSLNGVPVSADATHYDTDGKSVVNTYHIDLTKVAMAAGQAEPSGSVSVQEFTGGTTLQSESVFNYA